MPFCIGIGSEDMADVDWKQYGRLIVLIDAANLENSARAARLKVHYRRLARYFRERADLRRLCFYTPEFGTPEHNQFLRSLQRFGYQVVSKPVKVIALRDKPDVRKANFDVEIAVDAMAWLATTPWHCSQAIVTSAICLNT